MAVELLRLLLWLMALASIAYCLVGVFAARRFFSQPVPEPPPEFPPVSVLIPLCGSDFRAFENYVSLCRQSYPTFQLVFGVLDPQDSSVALIERLKADFTELDIELVVDTRTLGNNPKVSNLQNMLEHARYDTLILMDSDIRVRNGFLLKIAPHISDDRVGLVTCFYRGSEAPGMPSKLEAIGITAEFAPGVLVAWLMEGLSFALGATVATTKEKLSAIGGFRALADFLSDDYMLGQLMQQAGYEVRLLPEVVETVVPRVGFMHLLRHQVRWSRGIRACRPGGHLGLIFTHGTVMALVNWAISGMSVPSSLLLMATVAIRLWMGWIVGVKHLGDLLLKKYFLLLPVRDLFAFLVWCLSLVGHTVEWRGKNYRVLRGGKMDADSSPHAA
jgi:ceramide glucosyltransferase